jgi:hypothetical protein
MFHSSIRFFDICSHHANSRELSVLVRNKVKDPEGFPETIPAIIRTVVSKEHYSEETISTILQPANR